MKKVLNVFGIIFAAILSMILVPLLILAPVWQGMSGLLDPAFIENVSTEIVEEIDLSEISLNDPELIQSMTEAGITPEAAEALLESNTAREVVELLGQDLIQVLQGPFTTSALTEAEIARLVEENRQELIVLLRLLTQEDAVSITDAQLSDALDVLASQQAAPLSGEITQAMLEMQSALYEEFAAVMQLLRGPIILISLLGAAFVLALLIFLFRWPRQEGLMWLGIDAALAALPVLGIAVSLKGAQISQLLAQSAGVPNVFGPVLRHAGNTMLLGGLLLLAAAVLFIAGFILLRARRLKKAAAHADYAPTAHADYAPAKPAPIEPPVADSAERERSPWDNV